MPSYLDLMLEGLREVPAPPCEVPVRCDFYETCAKELLACAAFRRYSSAHMSPPHERQPDELPTAAIYRQCYPTTDDKRAKRS